MKTYCVTGGAGFIGSSVCKSLLAKGHRVINIDNFSDFYDYKAKVLNVLDSIHFSGKFPFVRKEEDLDLLIQLTQQKKYRLCVADICSLSAIYAVFQSETIDAVIHLAAMPGVRPSIENPLLYEGVNIKGTLNILEAMRRFNVLEIPVYGDGRTARDYTYIDDTVNGVISALVYVEDHNEFYEIVNIGTGCAITLQTMIRTIEFRTGKAAKLEQAPMQAGDVQYTQANIAKASLLLDYYPRVSFSEGINKQIHWQRGVAP